MEGFGPAEDWVKVARVWVKRLPWELRKGCFASSEQAGMSHGEGDGVGVKVTVAPVCGRPLRAAWAFRVPCSCREEARGEESLPIS